MRSRPIFKIDTFVEASQRDDKAYSFFASRQLSPVPLGHNYLLSYVTTAAQYERSKPILQKLDSYS